jgi:ribosomal protein L11 methyltransferase
VIRLALRVARADAEIALAELLELVPAGVEEVDRGDTIEYAVYGTPGELPQLPALRAAAGAAFVDVTTTEVADDWASRWRSFHKPLTVGDVLHVRPPWADAPDPSAGLLDIVIDPGQAFGTGAHDTTRLCLEALLELARAGYARGPLVDLGCGSGVLAIAASKLGWDPVRGVDHDIASVQATFDNAEVNCVAVAVAHGDLLRDGPAPCAPTVVANLMRPLLLHVAGGGFAAGAVPRTLILSGLLAHEADEAASAFLVHGLHEIERRHRGDWASLTLVA